MQMKAVRLIGPICALLYSACPTSCKKSRKGIFSGHLDTSTCPARNSRLSYRYSILPTTRTVLLGGGGSALDPDVNTTPPGLLKTHISRYWRLTVSRRKSLWSPGVPQGDRRLLAKVSVPDWQAGDLCTIPGFPGSRDDYRGVTGPI